VSWRGLRYKGVEILFPDEWNAVVDALNDLKSWLDSIKSARFDHPKQAFTLDPAAEQTLYSVSGAGLVVVELMGDGDGSFTVRVYVDGSVEDEHPTNVAITRAYSFDTSFELRLYNPATVSVTASSETIRLRGLAKYAAT
jgi:hypothetical protein